MASRYAAVFHGMGDAQRFEEVRVELEILNIFTGVSEIKAFII